MLRRKSIRALADEHVAIETVCRLLGMGLPDVDSVRSIKVHCPFGEFSHVDGGVEAAFRIYPDSNSAYCFACQRYYSPVSLAVEAWNRPPDEVAVDLLDRVGYKPASHADQWARLVTTETPPDPDALRAALDVFCSTLTPVWAERQMDVVVARTLGRCLGLLSLVRTAEDAERWLEATKEVMRRVLG